jgi:hypothetical protein
MRINGPEFWKHFLELIFQVCQTQTFANRDFERALLPSKNIISNRKKKLRCAAEERFFLFNNFRRKFQPKTQILALGLQPLP